MTLQFPSDSDTLVEPCSRYLMIICSRSGRWREHEACFVPLKGWATHKLN